MKLERAYERILQGPLKYAAIRSGIRRTITRRFPYGIYFSLDGDVIFIVTVLHTARDPAEWQFRIKP